MTPAEILALLGVLDGVFGLAGQLVAEALKREPALNAAPLPDLADVDAARADAVKRTAPSDL